MRVIEYQCANCEAREDVVGSVHDVSPAPQHCGQEMLWAPTAVPLGRFKYDPSKAGKDTGVYEYDYGIRATWDLTVPGKMEKLTKLGRIEQDPFDAYEDDLKSGKEKPYVSPVQSI